VTTPNSQPKKRKRSSAAFLLAFLIALHVLYTKFQEIKSTTFLWNKASFFALPLPLRKKELKRTDHKGPEGPTITGLAGLTWKLVLTRDYPPW